MNSPKSKFAVFDIDGTLFRSGLYREVFFEMVKQGSINQKLVDEVNPKMSDWRHRIHENAFEEFEILLTSLIDGELKKIKVSDYDTAAQTVIEQHADNVYTYTRDLLKSLKAEGYFLIAISGSQEELVQPFAEKYGFDAWVGQHWERGEKYFTGDFTKTHTGKAVLLQKFIDDYNLTLEDSYAVGDSNGYVSMLAMVSNPIAFNPTQELLEKAKLYGWKVIVERKNVNYELTKGSDGSYILA